MSQRKKSPTEVVRLSREEVDSHSSFLKRALQLFPDLRTIEDSMTGIAIPLLAQDIADGEPGNPARCAGSIAACRHIPGVTGGLINQTIGILVFDRVRGVRYHVPKTTYANLRAFDLGGTIEPGFFVLSPVPPSHRLISMQARIVRSKAMTGRPHVGKGQRRPMARQQRKSKARGKGRSMLIRTWGNATLPSDFSRPVIVAEQAA